MTLTTANYFSPEAAREYMSTSQFKAFMNCSAAVIAELNGEYEPEGKEAFVEGHMFEALVTGGEELFYAQHPEIISSQGKTKGNVKANYQRVIESAAAFNNQPAFTGIVKRCTKQVILSGVINGVKYKAALDLYDEQANEIWDIKCMRSFEDVYSADEGRRVQWWTAYGYQYQAAIYAELARQTFGKTPTFGLLAATKEVVPDVEWVMFDNRLLRNALDIVSELSPDYQAMKDGLIEPERCVHCDYCKATKRLIQPEIIVESEIV